MIVLDASAALDLLTGAGRAAAIRERIQAERVHVPHLIDIEITHVLRKHVMSGVLSAARAEAALSLWLAADLDRHAHESLLPRIWQLRQIVTAYDAAYVALAEAIGIPLITCDGRLARSHGHAARIEWLT